MIKFRRITYKDINLLRNMTLRKADMDELQAGIGIKDPFLALKHCVEYSTEWTEIGYEVETGEIITVFGLAKFENSNIRIGIPWMLASPNIRNHKKLLMAYSKKVVEEMLEQFEYLSNYVDSRNLTHIRWLKHMGFKFNGLEIETRGVPFLYFYKERE